MSSVCSNPVCVSVYWGLWASVGTYTHRNAPLSHSRLGLRPGNGVNLSLSVPGWSHPSRLWVQMPGSAGWVQDLDPVCRAVSLAEGLLREGHSPAAGHGSFISPHAGGMENHHVSGLRVFFRPFRSLAGRYLSAPIPAVRQHLRPFQKVSEGQFHEGIGSGWHPTPLVSMPWLPLLLWEALLEAPAMELTDPSYQPGTSLWAAMTEQQRLQGPAFTTGLRLTHPRPGPPLKEGTGFAS